MLVGFTSVRNPGLEDSIEGASAVGCALFLRSEIVAVASTAAVGEQLAAALGLVEEESRDVAGTDTLISDLGAGVWGEEKRR